MTSFEHKVCELRRRFREIGSAVVALSGGVDSAVLTVTAHEELETRMIAVTAVSPSLPARDLKAAETLCEARGIAHRIAPSREFEHEAFRQNPPDRCYHCKRSLYDCLDAVARELGFAAVVEGTNASDLAGHRPGYRASRENDMVVTPLVDAGFTKDEVRRFARDLGLGALADKPATACLSSRIPTGERLDPSMLLRIDRAEGMLHQMGLRQVRVRHHGTIARIEVMPDDMPLVLSAREAIHAELHKLGYRFVTLDIGGYRPSTP